MPILALLSFSLAFDTNDNSILVHHLHTNLGLTGIVLQWLSSYLTDRSQYISLSNCCSGFEAPVHSHVHQGSVLGPLLFSMYIKSLSTVFHLYSIKQDSFVADL